MKRKTTYFIVAIILICFGTLSILSSNRVHLQKDLGNSAEKENLIVLESPRVGSTVASPLTITGKARGTWFFEASFPVVLVDEQNKQVAVGVAQAKGEWMTEDFVPFSATLTFVSPAKGKGTLILKKDNPSGDPARDDSLRVPVTF
jgi:hypothetical protein